MLRGEFESAGESSPEALRREYGRVLAATIEPLGVESVAERAGLATDVVQAVADGEVPEVTLEAAAGILATDDERPDGETIKRDALDILLMGMTAAVVDVDSVAAGLNGEMEPKEIQQKVEGRYPITLEEYAAIHHFLKAR